MCLDVNLAQSNILRNKIVLDLYQSTTGYALNQEANTSSLHWKIIKMNRDDLGYCIINHLMLKLGMSLISNFIDSINRYFFRFDLIRFDTP